MTLYEFLCENCGYNVEAAGGSDYSMLAYFETMICTDCKIVADIPTRFARDDWPPPNKRNDATIGRCKQCNGTNLIKWIEPYFCPKCGEGMKKGRFAGNLC